MLNNEKLEHALVVLVPWVLVLLGMIIKHYV